MSKTNQESKCNEHGSLMNMFDNSCSDKVQIIQWDKSTLGVKQGSSFSLLGMTVDVEILYK